MLIELFDLCMGNSSYLSHFICHPLSLTCPQGTLMGPFTIPCLCVSPGYRWVRSRTRSWVRSGDLLSLEPSETTLLNRDDQLYLFETVSVLIISAAADNKVK